MFHIRPEPAWDAAKLRTHARPHMELMAGLAPAMAALMDVQRLRELTVVAHTAAAPTLELLRPTGEVRLTAALPVDGLHLPTGEGLHRMEEAGQPRRAVAATLLAEGTRPLAVAVVTAAAVAEATVPVDITRSK